MPDTADSHLLTSCGSVVSLADASLSSNTPTRPPNPSLRLHRQMSAPATSSKFGRANSGSDWSACDSPPFPTLSVSSISEAALHACPGIDSESYDSPPQSSTYTPTPLHSPNMERHTSTPSRITSSLLPRAKSRDILDSGSCNTSTPTKLSGMGVHTPLATPNSTHKSLPTTPNAVCFFDTYFKCYCAIIFSL